MSLASAACYQPPKKSLLLFRDLVCIIPVEAGVPLSRFFDPFSPAATGFMCVLVHVHAWITSASSRPPSVSANFNETITVSHFIATSNGLTLSRFNFQRHFINFSNSGFRISCFLKEEHIEHELESAIWTVMERIELHMNYRCHIQQKMMTLLCVAQIWATLKAHYAKNE